MLSRPGGLRVSPMEPALPSALEKMRAYLTRAQELQHTSALVSHVLRSFAMQVGMTLRDNLRHVEMEFLLSLMDDLERERSRHNNIVEAQNAVMHVAMDLYSRAKASDRPDIDHPHPSMKWTVVDAPKVAQAFHASAVLFDSLKHFGELSLQTHQAQAYAHRRSQQLSAQLARALGSQPVVALEWQPFPSSALEAEFTSRVVKAEKMRARSWREWESGEWCYYWQKQDETDLEKATIGQELEEKLVDD